MPNQNIPTTPLVEESKLRLPSLPSHGTSRHTATTTTLPLNTPIHHGTPFSLSSPLIHRIRDSYSTKRSRITVAISKLATIRERNVKLMLIHSFLLTMYQSICQWNLFDAYLSLLAKERGFVNGNTWVGFAEGISGMSTLLLAVPLGILVDTFNRIRLIRIAAVIGLIATVITAYAFAFDDITTLYTNLFLWGVFTGLQGTAAEAVFTDSVEKGQRSEKFTLKGVLNTCGLSLGPLLMLSLFALFGNNWGLRQLHHPLLAGCLFAPLACIPLFMMRDPKPKVDLFQATAVVGNQLVGDNVGSLRTPLLNSLRTTTITPSTPVLRRDRIGSTFSELSELNEITLLPMSASEMSAEEKRFNAMTRGERWIPFVITLADFVTEVGAGMTVRFFPLFFIHDYGLSPTALCCIFCAYPLCVSIGMPLCQKLSKIVGRAQASFAFQIGGITMLLLMSTVHNLPLLIIVFMIRGQLQNAAYPVDRSILMDYIPSKHRGKWNSVSSLASMTWSGSAVLGGYLADSHDYRFTFLITAAVYAVGITCYSPLLSLVPRTEGHSHDNKSNNHTINNNDTTVSETNKALFTNLTTTEGCYDGYKIAIPELKAIESCNSLSPRSTATSATST